MPIIDYKKNAELAEKAFFKNPQISQANQDLIRKFLLAYDVSPARLAIFLKHIRFLLERTNDIKKDMNAREKINSIFKGLRNKLSPSYYSTVVNVSLRLVRWLNDGERPMGFKDIKNSNRKFQKRNIDEEDMTNLEDREKLINKTNSIQFKAILATELDGGFRPSEFVDLDYGDVIVKKDSNLIWVSVNNGKTGNRSVWLFRANRHLRRWLDNHPTKKRKDPLWIQENRSKGKILRYKYKALQARINKIYKMAGIDKPCDFYALRHSAVSQCKNDGVRDEEGAKKFGHSIEYYTETYGRLSKLDREKTIERAYGLQSKEEGLEIDIPCEICWMENDKSSGKCERCGSCLSVKKALEIEKSKNDEINSLKTELSQLKQNFDGFKDDFYSKLMKDIIQAKNSGQKP